MKAFLILLVCLFALGTQAAPSFDPLQREAVRFLIEDSGGHLDGEEFVSYLRSSHLLTKKELRNFPEVMAHPGYHYVEIFIDDCVYDVAIVVIDPEGEALNALYIDFSERNR